jgi:hypothetical protein
MYMFMCRVVELIGVDILIDFVLMSGVYGLQFHI